MSELWPLILEHAVVLVVGVCLVVGMVLKAITVIVTTVARERSRREISAYVAEGTISPEQAERLIRAEIGGNRTRSS